MDIDECIRKGFAASKSDVENEKIVDRLNLYLLGVHDGSLPHATALNLIFSVSQFANSRRVEIWSILVRKIPLLQGNDLHRFLPFLLRRVFHQLFDDASKQKIVNSCLEIAQQDKTCQLQHLSLLECLNCFSNDDAKLEFICELTRHGKMLKMTNDYQWQSVRHCFENPGIEDSSGFKQPQQDRCWKFLLEHQLLGDSLIRRRREKEAQFRINIEKICNDLI